MKHKASRRSPASDPALLAAAVLVALALGGAADAAAPAGRYTSASGTVTDTKTRLVWQQTVSTQKQNWSNAKTYCAGLDSTLGGSGWRMPTVKELLTVVDYSQTFPSIDATAFPSTPADRFWSSSLASFQPGVTPYIVKFDIGAVDGSADQSNLFYVRCVR